jgi:hypothetical protein
LSGLRNPRALLAAGILVVAVVAGVVLVPGGASDPGGDGDRPLHVERAPLTLEAFTRPDTGERELLVSLAVPRLNSRDVTGGAPLVWLRCLDRRGATAIRRPIDWPLIEEPGFPPHIHQPASRRLLESIRSCRLTGPGMDFEGRVSGRLAAAG